MKYSLSMILTNFQFYFGGFERGFDCVNIDFYSPYQNNIETLIQGTEISLVLWSWWMVLNAGQVEIFQKNKIGVCILPYCMQDK